MADIGRSLETDYFRLDDEPTDRERAYWRTARDFVDDTALPVIRGHLRRNVMRHMADFEGVYTYYRTADIQTLLVGRDLTGISAFA